MQKRVEIFKKIASLPQYKICSVSLLNEAKKLFRQGAVKGFFWSKKSSLLSVVVENSGINRVIIRFNQERNALKSVCDCPRKLLCYHIGSVLMAIRYFTKVDYKYSHPYQKKEDDALRNSLFFADDVDGSRVVISLPAGISVCLFPQHEIVKDFESSVGFRVIKNNRMMIPEEYKKIPALASLVNGAYDINSENVFIKSVNKFAGRYPLYLWEGNRFESVRWDSNFLVNGVTQLDIIGDGTIQVRRVGSVENLLLDSLVRIGKVLVLDRITKRLGRLISKEPHVWNNANQWQAQLGSYGPVSREEFPVVSHSFEITSCMFNESIISLKSTATFSDIFFFKKKGKSVELENYSPRLQITIHQNKHDAQWSLLEGLVVVSDDYSLELLESYALDSLLQSAVRRAKKMLNEKSRALWMKGFFAASSSRDRDELHSIIDEVSSAVLAQDYVDKKRAITTFFTQCYKILRQEQVTKLFIIDDTFVRVAVDYRAYWLFVAVPQILFDTSKKIYGTLGSLVETEKLYASLSQLRAIVSSYGIDLYIDEKQVKHARIDITIDTTVRCKTDLFELRAQVYCEGQKLSDKEWQAILVNNGVWTREKDIIIVDKESCVALRLLLRWMNRQCLKASSNAIVAVARLRIFDLIELRHNGVTLKISDKDERILKSLSHFKAVPKIDLPKYLQCVLRDYQKEGYYWLVFLYQHQFGACLADDMGLGKTVQALALLGAIYEGIIPSIEERKSKKESRKKVEIIKKPHLIVVPASLVFNWVNEIKMFYPRFKIHEYTTTKNGVAFDDADVVITTYDIIRRDSKKLKKTHFNVIIFDEAQAIKNIFAQRTAAARLLQGDFKLCITGTPLENNVGEYYSIIDLAIPGLLSDYATFKSGGDSVISSVVEQTRPFILRRTKAIIAAELPERIESDVYFYMTKKQRALYIRIIKDIRNDVESAYKTKTKAQASIISLMALLRLRQICISPELVVPGEDAMLSPKIEYLKEQLPVLIEQGHAALVFSQFTKCLDLIEDELKNASIKYARIDGTVSQAKRKAIIESFQNDKIVDVLLMSLKTGGVGLNLTRASYVFHVDPWWNASVENQASDRAYRIGQKNSVMVMRLLMYHSIEEKMLLLKKNKEELFKAIVDGAGDKTSASMSKNDFDFLLSAQ